MNEKHRKNNTSSLETKAACHSQVGVRLSSSSSDGESSSFLTNSHVATRSEFATLLSNGSFSTDGSINAVIYSNPRKKDIIPHKHVLGEDLTAVAFFKEENENYCGINKSGNSSTANFDDTEEEITFYDCMEVDINDKLDLDSSDSEVEEIEEYRHDRSFTIVQPAGANATIRCESQLHELSNNCTQTLRKEKSIQSKDSVRGNIVSTIHDYEEEVGEIKFVRTNSVSPSNEANRMSTTETPIVETLESIENGDYRTKMMPMKSEQNIEVEQSFDIEACREGDSQQSSTDLASDARRGSFRSSRSFVDTFDAAQMKVERVEAYFFNNGMTVCLCGLFLSLNIVVAAHAAYQYMECGGFVTDNDILRATLPIARVGGRLVTFNCAWLLVTACKYSWTTIRAKLIPVIPIGFPIDDIMPKYHRFVALWIIVSGCIVHALPQIVNYATGALKIDDGRVIWTFGNGLATRQLLITGTLLTLIFTIFFLTTLESFRKTAAGFRWFWCFHMGGVAFSYPLLIVHGTLKGKPIFLWTALTPLILYAFDVAMRRFKVKTTKVIEWKSHTGGGQCITELVVECPPYFVYKPGQYVELNFKPISSTEWHPFTIASAPTSDIRIHNGKQVRVLIFFVKVAGRWTEALFDYASAFDLSKAKKGMDISIRGPHGAPAMNFFEYKHIIVIGSGVGVTPLLSVWQYMVDRGRFKLVQKEKHFDINSTECDSDDYTSDSIDVDASSKNDSMVMSEEDHASTHSVFSKTVTVMESLTVSIILYGFFLTLETIMAVTLIFGRHSLVAIMEILFASMSLIVHTTAMTIGVLAAYKDSGGGGSKLFGFRCWIEISIIVVDVVNLLLSLSIITKDENNIVELGMTSNENSSRVLLIVALGGLTVFLYAVRIFHLFYMVLKPTGERRKQQNKVSSIQGIFINRHYSGMRFCFEQLLQQPIEEEIWSNGLSLQFYGTQESGEPSESEIFPSYQNADWLSFREGRPNWESVFWKAIQKAQLSDPDGESIGVFFCGSPAIAKCLRSTADKINAQLQFAAKQTKTNGRNPRNFKIVLHVENY